MMNKRRRPLAKSARGDDVGLLGRGGGGGLLPPPLF